MKTQREMSGGWRSLEGGRLQGQTSKNPEQNSLCEQDLGKENQDQYWCLRSERRAGSGMRVAGDTGIDRKLVIFPDGVYYKKEGLWTP